VIGDRMFVTSGKNISIYDISDPAAPKALGGMTVNVAWENEEVPTNGKVLAVASDFYSVGDADCVAAMAPDGCVQFFDVRDPSDIKKVGTIPVANHTAECVLDCQYFYGRAGTIIDARGILDGTAPKIVGNWIDELRTQGVDSKSCHHIREIRPGVLLTACQPFAAISVNAEDGGSPEHPKVLYTGQAAKFVHSARWPREGGDKFLLTGGEENFTGRRERNNSEFSVYSAERVLSGEATTFDGPLAQVPSARLDPDEAEGLLRQALLACGADDGIVYVMSTKTRGPREFELMIELDADRETLATEHRARRWERVIQPNAADTAAAVQRARRLWPHLLVPNLNGLDVAAWEAEDYVRRTVPEPEGPLRRLSPCVGVSRRALLF
jgi:hypothetical protein